MGASDDDGSNEANLLPITAAFEAALEEALKARLTELVPEPKKQEVTRVIHEVVASFHGPLPPPSILRGYDEISPGRPIGLFLWPKGSKHTGIPGNNVL
jgi:hypothetical protein